MKSTKFQLDFKSLELKTEVKKKAIDIGKSMNQFILDCIEYPPIQLGNIEDELKKEGFVGRHFPKEQPTPSNSKLCKCGALIDKRFELCEACGEKKSPSKCEHCENGTCDYEPHKTGILESTKPTKKEYGYPKSRSLGKKK